MSTGIVICSVCFRELHQSPNRKWYHCEDNSLECKEGYHEYAMELKRIKGRWCGADNDGEK
jgi:hypothetical protein